jgi:hypothetical protein
MKARLLWVTSAMVYFFITIGFGIFIWNTLRNSITKSTLMVFIILATTILILETSYFLNADPSESPTASIFRFTFDSLSSSGLFSINQLFLVHITLDAINFIALLIVPSGLVAGCCIMHTIPITPYKGAEYFLGRSEQLKKLIAASSAVMVIGIIHMQLWLNWPLTFLDESNEIVQLKAVTQLVCQYWGVSYSLIIASVYFPAASYLSNQARLALLEGNDEKLKKEPSIWLIKNNMMFSPITSLSQIIAVIAPMLAGTFGTSLTNILFS